MPENNQNPSANGAEKREGNAAKNQNGQNRRNRHRPHHKGANKPRPEASEREGNTAPKQNAEQPQGSYKGYLNAPPRNRSDKQQNNSNNRPPKANQGNPDNAIAGNGNNNQKKNGKSGDRNQNRTNNRGQNRNRSFNRHDRESRMYDPYEAPSKQEIELSELRAQIVLKAADGTHPEAYGTPAPKQEPQEPIAVPPTVEGEASEEASVPLCPAPDTPTPVTEEVKKVEVVGVRFRSAGKMYYFDPHGIQAKKGECAIVETTRGPEFGDVCLGNTMVNADDTVTPLRPLLRIATPDDISRNAENRKKEQEALAVCQEKIRTHGLEMKLIDVQYAFDGSKLLFYFSAEGRVDFRELVKDLASVFRTRIELRQIGIRDEAKMLGGIGACGRRLCCATFLPDFAQVSIKMAKDQNLSLNSAKISGVCGRLMCCLRYEADVYAEEIRKTPSNDTLVRTEDGVGVVIGSNPLAGTIRVVLKESPDTAPKQYHRDSVTVLGKDRKGAPEGKNDIRNDTNN